MLSCHWLPFPQTQNFNTLPVFLLNKHHQLSASSHHQKIPWSPSINLNLLLIHELPTYPLADVIPKLWLTPRTPNYTVNLSRSSEILGSNQCARPHTKAVKWLLVGKGMRGRLMPGNQEQGHNYLHAHVPKLVGAPVNLKAAFTYTFCTALNDCNLQKQWRIRSPQQPVYEGSLSAPWPIAQAGGLFCPAKETFHSGPVCLLPSFSASHMLAASLELWQLLRIHCLGCLIGFLSNPQTPPILTGFFSFSLDFLQSLLGFIQSATHIILRKTCFSTVDALSCISFLEFWLQWVLPL